MMTASTIGKLLSKSKIVIFLFLLFITSPSFAGYYYVYPSAAPCCNSCEARHSCGSSHHRVVRHYPRHVHYAQPVRHHYHHSSRSQAKIEVYYYWPGLPGAPCGQVWVPDQCDCCGHCTPGYWSSGANTVYQSQPDDGYASYVVENPGPDYDMDTRDSDE